MNRLSYGWYGDDFTGATDTLGTLAGAGLRAMLFLRVPGPKELAAAGELDAMGIAGAARAMAPAAMADELEPVAAFFSGLGVSILHYKCCSTFDSAPQIGSIGAAAATLRRHFPNPLLAIVGGQPNIGRYCLFSTLFAAAGAGGAVERIDRHPTMIRHPVTPMGEADLRRHLAAQGLSPVSGLHYPAYAEDGQPLEARLADLLASRPAGVLFDVATVTDLGRIGRLLWQQAAQAPMLCIGASSVATALAPGIAPETVNHVPPMVAAGKGGVLVMAGSLSPVTARQVAAAGDDYTVVVADGGRLVREPACRLQLHHDVAALLAQGRDTLVVTAPPEGAAFDPALSAAVATASAGWLAGLLAEVRPSRVGIAGGDTSSRAVLALGAWGLSCAASIAPGVALSRLHSANPRLDGLEIMLKGGQMGPPDIFLLLRRGL